MKKYSCITLFILFGASLYGADFESREFYINVGFFNKAIADSNSTEKTRLLLLLINKKQEAFENAVLMGYEHAAEKLAKFPGINTNSVDSDGKRLIHVAASAGHKKIVELFLDRDIDIDILCEKRKYSPLHYAAYFGKDEVAKHLIERGASVAIEADSDHVTPLVCAIQGTNTWGTFQLLLSKYTKEDLDCQYKPNGANAMHVAAQFGRGHMVKALLDKGAGHDVSQWNGATPLMLACEKGHIGVVRLLVVAKSRVNFVSDKGSSPLIMASGRGHLELVKYLLTIADIDVNIACEKVQVTAFFAACVKGHIAIANELLQAQASSSSAICIGIRLLSMIAYHGSGDLLSLLLSQDSQFRETINQSDATGSTPLHLASKKGNFDAIRILLENGAKINATDDYGKTALFYACQFGNKSAVKKLLERGANKIIKDKKERLPIEIAQKNKHENIVKFLGKDIKQKGKKNKPKATKKQKEKRGAKPPLSLSHVTKEEEKEEEELAYEDAPASKQNQVSISHASTHMVARRERGIKLDPSSLFKFNVKKDADTHVVIEQEWNQERKLLVVYKRLGPDLVNLAVNMKPEYKQQDMFHGFDDTVDNYLCHGIKIGDNSDLLLEYNVTLPIDCYAIVLPGKIAHQYYDYQYVDDDCEIVERGQFDGAFVYLFDKHDGCFHRMFHQSRASRAINNSF